ncbi:hypothetical protein LOC67_24470 [Stieleria sp. JC731]|uniref:hypothetical protein n=1 Tax=Pirellulaceae TaxID=2691357 RepID=UPI001E61D04F|nr:hypothetical protein [Stieleria sp. JC731]MCC9603717.1 hypothetical protein [Stieleria sp. JC731]
MFFWWIGPLFGAVLVAGLLYFIGPMIKLENEIEPAGWAAIGAFFGLFLMPFSVTPWLAPRAIRKPFHKEL